MGILLPTSHPPRFKDDSDYGHDVEHVDHDDDDGVDGWAGRGLSRTPTIVKSETFEAIRLIRYITSPPS